MNFAKLHSKKVYGKKISFLGTHVPRYLFGIINTKRLGTWYTYLSFASVDSE